MGNDTPPTSRVLAAWLKERGWTQAELARAAGLNAAIVNFMLQGRNSQSLYFGIRRMSGQPSAFERAARALGRNKREIQEAIYATLDWQMQRRRRAVRVLSGASRTPGAAAPLTRLKPAV